MRTPIFLSALALCFAGCSVVPEPTSPLANADSTVIGNWTSSVTTAGVLYIHQLSLSSRTSYLRTVHDSTVGTNTPRRLAMQEDGSWKIFRANDTSWLVLTPRFRQITTVVPNTPDTASWEINGSNLRWNARCWNRRDAFEALIWTAY